MIKHLLMSFVFEVSVRLMLVFELYVTAKYDVRRNTAVKYYFLAVVNMLKWNKSSMYPFFISSLVSIKVLSITSYF